MPFANRKDIMKVRRIWNCFVDARNAIQNALPEKVDCIYRSEAIWDGDLGNMVAFLREENIEEQEFYDRCGDLVIYLSDQLQDFYDISNLVHRALGTVRRPASSGLTAGNYFDNVVGKQLYAALTTLKDEVKQYLSRPIPSEKSAPLLSTLFYQQQERKQELMQQELIRAVRNCTRSAKMAREGMGGTSYLPKLSETYINPMFKHCL